MTRHIKKQPMPFIVDATHDGGDPPPTKITRVSVDLSPYQVGLLEALTLRTGMSKAGVLRFGLTILCDAAADRDEGFIFGAWKGDKERRYSGI